MSRNWSNSPKLRMVHWLLLVAWCGWFVHPLAHWHGVAHVDGGGSDPQQVRLSEDAEHPAVCHNSSRKTLCPLASVGQQIDQAGSGATAPWMGIEWIGSGAKSDLVRSEVFDFQSAPRAPPFI